MRDLDDDVDLINNAKALALKSRSADSRHLDLPPELLVEIFFHSVSGKNAVTPYLLGKICREWRALVFDSCSLWQVLELKLKPNHDTQLSLLEEWVSRAGILPLTVTICYPTSAGPSEPSKHPGLLKPILSLPSTRVSSLWLADLPWGFFFAVSAANPVGSWPSHGLPFPIFTSPPLIRIKTRTEQQSIFSENCLLSEFIHRRLNHSHAHIGRWTLQRLTFSNDTNTQSALFNSLRLSGLTNLALQLGHRKRLTPDGKERPIKFEIYPFLSESGCQLTDLAIDNAALTEPQIIACLCILPSLRTLRLSNNKWYDEEEGEFFPMGPTLLRFMTSFSSVQQPILPALEQLTFVGSRVAFSPDVVIEFLRSRWGSRGALSERSTISLQTVVFNVTGRT
ncbi:hypothetical protein D9611_013600 [Ephemerocybe angulata]|uniref:F-box domain-containing protein n=1 Tax=Ephemerocybe angulata TaxID=980116 RepID=A0A8H5ERL1_9AGAR|nr:hypothetical protein D9611_013600 [Tulosesus angulatus]